MRRLLIALAVILSAQTALAAESLRKEDEATGYYIDKDGDLTRDTDGTEPFVDFTVINVPLDYATVQAALDSNDCREGSTTANQGCHILVAPGTYAESFTLGGTTVGTAQNSVIIEGVGPAGTESGSGAQTCGVTFTGNDTSNNTVVSVEGSIGWALKNFCIDMDEAATNDPQHGIRVGADGSQPIKHGLIDSITIEDGVVSGGSAITIGNGASADIAFNMIKNVKMVDVQTCLVISSSQAVDNEIHNTECTSPDAAIGGVSITSVGGEMALVNFYFKPGAASQIGINIRNEALGAIKMDRLTFEWPEDNGTFINFEDPGTNQGAYRAYTITNSRFQPQTIATTRHVCVDWNRRGTLNLIGNSFESGTSSSRSCEFDFNNPSATSASDVYWIGNDVQWNGTQSDPRVTRTTSGGRLSVAVMDDGDIYNCNGAAAAGDLALTATGCYGLGQSGASTAATASVNDDDTSIATTAFVQAETVAAGDVTGTIGGGLTIGANTVALSTDTTGNYVATIADSGASEVTVSGSGSEGAAVTLALAAGITRDAELAAYTTGTTTPVDGSTACNTGDMHLETDAFKIYFCTDGATDKWYGVLLSDTP